MLSKRRQRVVLSWVVCAVVLAACAVFLHKWERGRGLNHRSFQLTVMIVVCTSAAAMVWAVPKRQVSFLCCAYVPGIFAVVCSTVWKCDILLFAQKVAGVLTVWGCLQ